MKYTWKYNGVHRTSRGKYLFARIVPLSREKVLIEVSNYRKRPSVIIEEEKFISVEGAKKKCEKIMDEQFDNKVSRLSRLGRIGTVTTIPWNQ